MRAGAASRRPHELGPQELGLCAQSLDALRGNQEQDNWRREWFRRRTVSAFERSLGVQFSVAEPHNGGDIAHSALKKRSGFVFSRLMMPFASRSS